MPNDSLVGYQDKLNSLSHELFYKASRKEWDDDIYHSRTQGISSNLKI